ncbi:hypothetical protein EU97_0211 [Prochlorococcus marinus str. MIT 9311]|nr:hypothetical protein EU97_0211 [Prochlorococcus marinus str. MIT 9311]
MSSNFFIKKEGLFKPSFISYLFFSYEVNNAPKSWILVNNVY